MKTSLIAAILAPALLLSAPVMAQEDDAAFGERVRAYLLENPEVIMEAVAALEARQAEAQNAADADLVATNADSLFESGDDWVGGNPDGDVTIVEFFDYRCGYCRRAHPEVSELIESDGNIRLILKEFPILGPESVLASRFALSARATAGDEAYGQVKDALMTMEQEVTPEALVALAEDLDLDGQAILEGMGEPEIEETISRNRALGQSMGITGTPSFVFGDQLVRGYVPLDAMREIVEEERSEG